MMGYTQNWHYMILAWITSFSAIFLTSAWCILLIQNQQAPHATNNPSYNGHSINHDDYLQYNNPPVRINDKGEIACGNESGTLNNNFYSGPGWKSSRVHGRTKNTALPSAINNNLDLTLYHPGNINYKEFISKTKGKTVLIVGHSNTIPLFVNELIAKEKYKLIEDNIFGNYACALFKNELES